MATTRVILHLVDGIDDALLQVRAAQLALARGIRPGDLWGSLFEDGTGFSVHRTKAGAISVRSNKSPEDAPLRTSSIGSGS